MDIEVILDTETTGFEPSEGHRIVEIGCVEVRNRIPTGRSFHKYINPEREMPLGAFQVHGLSTEFLSDKPKFAEIVDEFVEFIGGKKLVIHNADFDIKFLNHELGKAGKKKILNDLVFCTLKYSRSKFPGMQNSLDALCKRFNVDNSRRDKHGALLDAEILAEVYLELMGGKQVTFELDSKSQNINPANSSTVALNSMVFAENIVNLPKRTFAVDEEELKLHEEFIAKMKNPIWKRQQN